MEKIRILELFGGIGACSKALERLGIDYEIADYVEIDKYAVKSFNAIHNTNFEPQDVTQWDKDIKVDLIMHGSPCQDFSLAGKQAGGDEGSGTRSSLMYETIRIVEKLKPKYVIWENVKNLLSKKHRHNFDAYLEKMEQLGYTNYYQVLNAKDYGIPQNRERVFTVSILGNENYEFPKCNNKVDFTSFLEKNVDNKYYFNIKELFNHINFKRNNYYQDSLKILNNELDKNKTYALDLRYDEGFRIRKNDTLPTLTTKNYTSRTSTPLIYNNGKLRGLTPLEQLKFMGFSEEDYNKMSKINEENQIYKQAGNSIVVNVLEVILKQLFKERQITRVGKFDDLD